MNDKNGNDLFAGDTVVVTGTVDVVNGEHSIVFRPHGGQPLHIPGTQVLKVEPIKAEAPPVVEVPVRSAAPAVASVVEPIVPVQPSDPVEAPVAEPFVAEETPLPPPAPLAE